MKKLKLDLDELKIESFETNTAKEKRHGTVHGNATYTADGTLCYSYCHPSLCIDTCDGATCQTDIDICYTIDCG